MCGESKTPSTPRSDSLQPTLSTSFFSSLLFSWEEKRASVLFACAFIVKTHVPRLFEIFPGKITRFDVISKIVLSFLLLLLLFFISKIKTWRRFEGSLYEIYNLKREDLKDFPKFSANFDNSDYF